MEMQADELPPLTREGLLPEGVHAASLGSVKQRFGQFQQSDCRCRLFKKLEDFVREVGGAGWRAHVIVDGSFVMACVDEPSDIDIILVLPKGWDMSAEVRPFEYNLLSRRRTRSRYGFDVIAVRSDSEEESYWIEFFRQVNTKWNNDLGLPVGLRKGLIRVTHDQE